MKVLGETPGPLQMMNHERCAVRREQRYHTPTLLEVTDFKVISLYYRSNTGNLSYKPLQKGQYSCRIFFFFYQQFFIFFFFFSHTTNIQTTISKIKQNKTADTYSTSQGSIKREGEREGQQEHKSHSFK